MALPRQRRDESDAEFLRRLDEYHCKERARDKRRSKTAERRKYLADYMRRRAAVRRLNGSSYRRRQSNNPAAAVEYNGPQHYFPGVFGRDTRDFVLRQCYDVDKYEQLTAHGLRVIVIDCRYDTKAKISQALLASGVLHG
jgi:hypothetical protein